MGKAAKFTAWDFALLKTMVAFAGLLIGGYHPRTVRKLSPFLWAGAALSWGALIYRMFLRPEKEDTSIYQ
jgi:hypothetical protein